MIYRNGPGKFEGEPLSTNFAYHLSLNGDGETWSNEGWGDNSTLIEGPFTEDDIAAFLHFDDEYASLNVDDEDVANLRGDVLTAVAVHVSESSSGFVCAEWFTSKADVDACRARLDKFYATDDEDDEDSPYIELGTPED